MPNDTSMQNVDDEMWWNRFVHLNQSNLLGFEACNYMDYNEDYYIAKRKGEFIASEQKKIFIERYNAKIINGRICSCVDSKENENIPILDTEADSIRNEPFVFHPKDTEFSELFESIRCDLSDNLEDIDRKRRFSINLRIEKFQDMSFVIQSGASALCALNTDGSGG